MGVRSITKLVGQFKEWPGGISRKILTEISFCVFWCISYTWLLLLFTCQNREALLRESADSYVPDSAVIIIYFALLKKSLYVHVCGEANMSNRKMLAKM